MAEEFGLFDPVSASMQPLVNDLEGKNPLFTPRVWNSLFLGEDQREITDWVPEPRWETITRDWEFIWDKVVGTSLLNVNVHTNYLHQRACIPDGFTPTHGSWGMMVRSTEELISHWNETLGFHEPPLQIGYFRFPDAFGHWASKKGNIEDHSQAYDWMRESFWQQIELPDEYVVLSDHGFVQNPAEGEGGREEHAEHGVVASTFPIPLMGLTQFIENWHDLIIERVRTSNLEALGYL